MRTIEYINDGEVIGTQLIFESEKERDDYFGHQIADLKRQYMLNLAEIQSIRTSSVLEKDLITKSLYK